MISSDYEDMNSRKLSVLHSIKV